jgi:hypothetical protein
MNYENQRDTDLTLTSGLLKVEEKYVLGLSKS